MIQDSRTVPQDAEAEAIVLGCMSIDATARATACELVGLDDFFRPAHRTIFAVLVEMGRQDLPAELPALQGQLQQRGKLEAVGGVEKLVDLCEVPSTVSVGHYAERLRAMTAKRRVIVLCHQFLERAHDPTADSAELLAEFQADAYALTAQQSRGGTTIGEGVHQAAMQAGRRQFPGLRTGFATLDWKIGGLKPGELITLAGETSAGKSTLAQNIVENVLAAGGSALIASAEMRAAQICRRILASQSGVYAQQLQRGTVDAECHEALQTVAAAVDGWRGYILDGTLTVPAIVAKARQLTTEWGGPPSVIVVDHLQLIRDKRTRTRREEVSAVAWELKQAATDLSVPVLMLSQLSRAGQGRGDDGTGRRPELWHLKESGDVENCSDTVLLIYHPNVQAPNDPVTWEVWLRVAKCRDGMGTPWPDQGRGIRLRWQPMVTRFEPIDEYGVPSGGEGEHDPAR